LLHGSVRAASGGPVSAASVTVIENGRRIRATSDVHGAFDVGIEPGSVRVVVVAQGFQSVEIGPLAVDGDQSMDVVLVAADTGALRTIAVVTVNGAAINVHAFVPSIDITRRQMSVLGFDHVLEALGTVPSVTFARPDGGAPTAPVPVALRGPDPSETLVMLDGEVLNDGNTGDLDVSQLPVSAFSGVEVSEGLGPIDLQGSNTFGGAVNLFSLRPTPQQHEAESISFGSFGRSEAWVNATGSAGPLGYAVALDDTQQHGYVDQNDTLCTGGYDAALPAGLQCIGPQPVHLGSTIAARTALVNVTYAPSQRSDIGLRIFDLGDARDTSGSENSPVFASDQGSGAYFTGPGETIFDQTLRAYQLHARMPLGAGTLVAEASEDDDGVTFTGSGVSPYDVSHADRRQNLSLWWERDGDDYLIAFGGYVRHETLAGDFIGTTLAQTIHNYFARGEYSPTERLHLEGGAYFAQYSTFGSDLDGRLGAAYDLDSTSAVHVSAGTGFRAPLLIERYVFPLAALPRDANGVYLGQGNPGETPEHATEYELGYSKKLQRTQIEVSLYRTNLRNPIENYYPLAMASAGLCFAAVPACQEYPTNVGNAVYQGLEVRLGHQFGEFFTAHVAYGINVAYPRNLPSTVSNPTSGGSLVNGEQFLNIPPQQASFDIEWLHDGWHAGMNGVYRGRNNELNAGPFAIVNGSLGYTFGALDLTVIGTNLTDAVAGKFTLLNAGVPYPGIGGPLPTNLYAVDPAGFRIELTARQ
jgi:hypothetical protein